MSEKNCLEDFQDAIARNRVLYTGQGKRFTDYQPDWLASSRRFREMLERDAKHEHWALVAHALLVVLHIAFIIGSHL